MTTQKFQVPKLLLFLPNRCTKSPS